MNVSHSEHIQGSSFPGITRWGPAKIPVSRRSAQERSHLGTPGQDPQSLFGLEHESQLRPKGVKEPSPTRRATASQQGQQPHGLEAKLANDSHRSSHLLGRTRTAPRIKGKREGGMVLLGIYS